MAVRRGTATPSAVFRGTVPVKKVMRGTVEVWSATLPSIYPVSGTWNSAITSSAATYADHTIAESGTFTITHTVTGGGQYVSAAIAGPWGTTTGAFGPPSTATTTQTLAAGALIQFQAGALIPSGTASGSWSITKEALTVVTVTPQAPTFLTESPWYTLPTQAGVTYTVSGTPGYNQTVTVTATPQAGYALAGQTSWTHTYGTEPLPVVTITGTSGVQSRDQFHAACTQYGVNYQTVQVLPFRLDTSQATNLTYMFNGCSALTTVPDLDTSQATNLGSMFRNCSSLTTVPDLATSQVQYLNNMFYNCSALTDGNVRCIGRFPGAATGGMISGSGLTREPFYDTNGNPI